MRADDRPDPDLSPTTRRPGRPALSPTADGSQPMGAGLIESIEQRPARGALIDPGPTVLRAREHTVEIVSDAGEGAQKCGQIFGAVSAKMGNGVWTVEIIPAEIQPPPRIPEGASGYRIRIGSGPVTNWGDESKLIVAFNEQVLLARHRLGALAEDATILVEDMWASHDNADVRRAWDAAMEELSARRYRIVRVPMEEQCLTLVDNPRKGKNMFALGLLSRI
ncbi:MAG TPA: 2-oxoacid:acceptor oxidoreductase family protein, partial [Gemmatimonadaceae bacterium]|nr:2-oxoacid:acceptor oxidoreductase family protein [Gemmatimonadaceae bacterium]